MEENQISMYLHYGYRAALHEISERIISGLASAELYMPQTAAHRTSPAASWHC